MSVYLIYRRIKTEKYKDTALRPVFKFSILLYSVSYLVSRWCFL